MGLFYKQHCHFLIGQSVLIIRPQQIELINLKFDKNSWCKVLKHLFIELKVGQMSRGLRMGRYCLLAELAQNGSVTKRAIFSLFHLV